MAKAKNGNDEAAGTKAKPADGPQRERNGGKSDQKPQHHGTWRETIESVAIAFILAFLFRSFEAEAFVIPTGSMATTLMGRHKDLKCPKCGYWYQVSSSEEVDRDSGGRRIGGRPEPDVTVTHGICPMCRFAQETTRRAEQGESGRERPDEDPAGTSYKGDRIIVVKSYNVLAPERWDVFVFRYPQEAATIYINRLVGLPEVVLHFDDLGDVYVRPLNSDDSAFRIARKPPDKILAMSRDVYDNDYVVDEMTKLGWPPRWQPCPENLPQLVAAGWPQKADVWVWDRGPQAGWTTKDGFRTFQIDGQGERPQWLRYQHLVPRGSHWQAMSAGHSITTSPEPKLIENYLAYNDALTAAAEFEGGAWRFSSRRDLDDGSLPWVGDLILECTLSVQGRGAAVLELIEGGRRFQCQLDFKTGDATLSIDGGKTPFETEDRKPAQATLTAKGVVPTTGSFDVRLANVDRQLVLWIDDDVVEFGAPALYSFDNGMPDPFDHSPVGIASLGAPLAVERLRIKRDIFYGSRRPPPELRGNVQDITYDAKDSDDQQQGPLKVLSSNHGLYSNDYVEIRDVHGAEGANGTFAVDYIDPDRFALVDTTGAGKYTGGGKWRRINDFVLFKNHFFALGDNSARSLDSREWDKGRKYVHRDLLIGQAFFIFWPHSWDDPVPFTPNFPRMGFVR